MEGKKVAGYAIKRKIAEGGMGVVYEAAHRTYTRVALKLMLSSLTGDEKARKYFLRETRLISELTGHPNVVRHIANGESRGRLYLATELLEGESLTSFIASHPEITAEERLEIVKQVCRAIAHAHNREIIHRDLKPDNIFVVRGKEWQRDWVKVLDFGIAKSLEDDATKLTHVPSMKGTWTYMAPEQLAGEDDERSDVFAIGLIAFYVFMGRDALRETTAAGAVGERHGLKTVPLHCPGMDARLQRILARATTFDPAGRYENAAELLLALERSDDVGAPVPTIMAEAPTPPRSPPTTPTAVMTAPAAPPIAALQAPPKARKREDSRDYQLVSVMKFIAFVVLAAIASIVGMVKYSKRGTHDALVHTPTVTVVHADSGVVARDASADAPSSRDTASDRPRRAHRSAPSNHRVRDDLPEFPRYDGVMYWPEDGPWYRLPLARRREICRELRRRDHDPPGHQYSGRFHQRCTPEELGQTAEPPFIFPPHRRPSRW